MRVISVPISHRPLLLIPFITAARTLLFLCLLLTATMGHTSEACNIIKTSGGSWINNSKTTTSSSGGAGLQLMSAIESELGIKIQILPAAPFARQLHQLKSGQIDILFGLYAVPERLNDFYFSEPYFIESLYIVSHKNLSLSASEMNKLTPFKGVIVRGASYGNDLDMFFKTNKTITKVNKHEQRINLVVSRRADYFISSSQTAQSKIINQPQLHISEHPISHVGTTIAFSKKSPCLSKIDKINQIIRSLKKS